MIVFDHVDPTSRHLFQNIPHPAFEKELIPVPPTLFHLTSRPYKIFRIPHPALILSPIPHPAKSIFKECRVREIDPFLRALFVWRPVLLLNDWILLLGGYWSASLANERLNASSLRIFNGSFSSSKRCWLLLWVLCKPERVSSSWLFVILFTGVFLRAACRVLSRASALCVVNQMLHLVSLFQSWSE